MKQFYISLLLLCTFLLSGCVNEDMASCPAAKESNLVLTFRYTDDQQMDVFSDKIHRVDVFIFDEADRLVYEQSIDKVALSAFAGVELNLQKGDYHIVCWGNANDKTEFDISQGSLFKDAFLGHSSLKTETTATNGDPLYYSSSMSGRSLPQGFKITVPEEGDLTQTISFNRAHIEIGLYVKGFEDKSASGELLLPIVELTHIPPYYDFEMKTFGDIIPYQDVLTLQTIEDEEMATIDFYTPFFAEDTPMRILIKKASDGTTVTEINLKDFIQENNITIQFTGEVVIPILVEYKQTSVSITLPGWVQTPVNPELK